MTRLRDRETEQIIERAVARAGAGAVGPAGPAGPPGAPGGVTSYNGRVGVVTSVVGDIVAHHTTHENAGSDQISLAGLTGVSATPQPPIIGATGTTAVAGNDARLTDARTPTAHAATHQPGGTDAMAVDAVAATGSLRTLGTGAAQAAAGNDSRLSDARVPTAHHATHEPGGTDAMAVDAIAATGSLRTLGTGAQQAAAGNHTHAEADVTNLVTDLAAKVPTTRNINTTAPVTGGGNLSADRTIAVSDFVGSGATHARGTVPDPGAVAGTSKFLREDATWVAPPAASFALTTVECNLGAAPNARRSGHVQITGLAGLTVGKPVFVQQAAGPYTGKGTRADEAEMDMLRTTGKVLSATTIDIYWEAVHRVRGNFKFDYAVAA